MTFGVWVLFGSLRGRVGFCSGSCTFFYFRVRFGSVLGKTWVLVRFVLAGFGFFPISGIVNIICCGLNRAGSGLKLARAHLYTILVESESRGGEGGGTEEQAYPQ